MVVPNPGGRAFVSLEPAAPSGVVRWGRLAWPVAVVALFAVGFALSGGLVGGEWSAQGVSADRVAAAAEAPDAVARGVSPMVQALASTASQPQPQVASDGAAGTGMAEAEPAAGTSPVLGARAPGLTLVVHVGPEASDLVGTAVDRVDVPVAAVGSVQSGFPGGTLSRREDLRAFGVDP